MMSDSIFAPSLGMCQISICSRNGPCFSCDSAVLPYWTLIVPSLSVNEMSGRKTWSSSSHRDRNLDLLSPIYSRNAWTIRSYPMDEFPSWYWGYAQSKKPFQRVCTREMVFSLPCLAAVAIWLRSTNFEGPILCRYSRRLPFGSWGNSCVHFANKLAAWWSSLNDTK